MVGMVAESVASSQEDDSQEAEESARRLALLAAEQATGLRALASMIEAHPQLASLFEWTLTSLHVPLLESEGSARENLRAIMRAAKAHGAEVLKDATEERFKVIASWPGLGFKASAARELVCERVVVGTDTVTREVPDPEQLAKVPTVEVTETVERVEWRCSPLLAEAVSR